MPRKGRVKTVHFPYSIEQFLFPFLRDSKLHFFQWLIFHEMRARMKCWMVQSLFFAASSFLPSITSTIRISLKVFYSFSYFIEINCFVELNHFNFFQSENECLVSYQNLENIRTFSLYRLNIFKSYFTYDFKK